MDNKIKVKKVIELIDMQFYIPNYQRGYRWEKEQVTDLLDDIFEFAQKIDKDPNEFYCLQPLVVKTRDEDNILERVKNAQTIDEVKKIVLLAPWEVIDGQQRLTTIHLILNVLKQTSYSISYQTRDSFDTNNGDNINSHYIKSAEKTIEDWFNSRIDKRNIFTQTLLNHVSFIWYETKEEDPIKVFTRLNIGKVPLTNAELVKALMLNRSNFDVENINAITLQQQEIAIEWDNIEYTLQNDEFWLFMHSTGYKKPTRIDFIFDLVVTNNSLNLPNNDFKKIGTDEYRTFRYFYKYFSINKKDKPALKDCWAIIKKYFYTFVEWYNDIEMYHYVGYLVELGTRLNDIYNWWEGRIEDKDRKTHKKHTKQNTHISKEEFKEELKKEIKSKIKLCKDLDYVYEVDKHLKKTVCKPLLLLHNIQSIIDQNNQIKENEKYGLSVFYKFPFHLFKREKWDVEHIDSNTTNDLENEKDQIEWLKYALLEIPQLEEDFKEEINKFVERNIDKKDFQYFANRIDELRDRLIDKKEKWDNPREDKNKVWNYVLLDAGTNRGYGNAIFPAKRRTIIAKEQSIKKEIKVSESGGFIYKDSKTDVAFIPPITKHVFLKYYTPTIDNFSVWTKNDATYYRTNIEQLLEYFLKD
jgi:hypothetical protein